MSMTLVFNLALSSCGFAVGSVYLKRFADHGSWLDLSGALLIFGLSNLAYAQVLAKGLGQGAVLSSMAQLIIMSAAGVMLFGERFGLYHVAGLVSALTTIWFFTLANHGG